MKPNSLKFFYVCLWLCHFQKTLIKAMVNLQIKKQFNLNYDFNSTNEFCKEYELTYALQDETIRVKSY